MEHVNTHPLWALCPASLLQHLLEDAHCRSACAVELDLTPRNADDNTHFDHVGVCYEQAHLLRLAWRGPLPSVAGAAEPA